MSKRKTNLPPAPKSADKKPKKNQPAPSADASLFDRVASILEQARGNVVRAVNTNMVLAYWLIGREIVQDLQGGKGRAEYGEKIIEDLSMRLTESYGSGFSKPVLWNFRQFYLTYSDREKILFPAGRELDQSQKLSPVGREFSQGFSSQLTWSHYRALMRVENREARDFSSVRRWRAAGTSAC